MAVEHSDEALNAATDGVLGLLGEAAKLNLRIAGTLASPGAIAATLIFGFPAFGAAGAGDPGKATANAMTQDSDAVGNASAVANGSFETSGDSMIIHFAVAASGSDLNLTGGLTIAAHDIVSITTPITYTAMEAP